jgi:glycosyltransferase involved in cell wall biosynthesis
MRSAAFLHPGRIDTLTGGSIYDRRMIAGLRDRGWSVDVIELHPGFPFPTPAALVDARLALADLPDDTVVLVDGLAFGAMPQVVGGEACRLRLIPIVHLPLACDIGLDPDTASRLESDERDAMAAARMVVVTGESTREILEGYGVAPDALVLIEPGVDEAPLAVGSGGSQLELLCVGTLNPGKGHELLIRALATLSNLPWHLTCAGSLSRHPATVAQVETIIRDCGLEARVSLLGEVGAERLAACYARADLFVLATLRETYGMAVAEAIAHGLPVVSTTTGAIPTLVGGSGGLLVAPGDQPALTGALERAITDAALRRDLAAGARAARGHLRPWSDAFDRMAAALERIRESHD